MTKKSETPNKQITGTPIAPTPTNPVWQTVATDSRGRQAQWCQITGCFKTYRGQTLTPRSGCGCRQTETAEGTDQ